MPWDFIENATVEAIDTVPEEHRPYYVEDKTEGKFVLKPDVVPLAQALTNSQKAIAKANLTRKEDSKKDAARRIALDGIVTALTEAGVEVEDTDVTKLPDIVKTKIAEFVEAGKSGKDNKVNIENVKKAMEGQITKLKADHASELGAMRSSLEEYLIDSVAMAELAKAGTIDSAPDLLLPKVRESVKVVKTDDGKYVPRVIDTDGTFKFNDKGVEMSVSDLVGSMKTKYPNMFKSQEKGGGGAPTNKGTPKTQQKTDGMNSVDKIAAGLDGIKRQ